MTVFFHLFPQAHALSCRWEQMISPLCRSKSRPSKRYRFSFFLFGRTMPHTPTKCNRNGKKRCNVFFFKPSIAKCTELKQIILVTDPVNQQQLRRQYQPSKTCPCSRSVTASEQHRRPSRPSSTGPGHVLQGQFRIRSAASR